LLCLVIPALILSTGCSRKEEPIKVDLGKREAVAKTSKMDAENTLHIAVGGMITPREGYLYYRQFLDYIGERLGRHVELIDREDYAEINSLVKTGKVDVAFVCGGPYVDGHKEFGMELLVAPVAYGGTVYYSYIIVAKNSLIKSFNDLRGKSFAFTDPLSNSGRLVPLYMLGQMHETPETFFKKYVYTAHHDKSIKAVAQGIVDAAAVDSLVWEYAERINPEFSSKTRIIKKSPPYGIPPVVVRPDLDADTKNKLRNIFLNANNDEKGREILKGMMIDRFVVMQDSAYDSIREMKSWLESQRTEESRPR
jgi:phosphonate transport system substrate-binding protein